MIYVGDSVVILGAFDNTVYLKKLCKHVPKRGKLLPCRLHFQFFVGIIIASILWLKLFFSLNLLFYQYFVHNYISILTACNFWTNLGKATTDKHFTHVQKTIGQFCLKVIPAAGDTSDAEVQIWSMILKKELINVFYTTMKCSSVVLISLLYPY